MSSAIAGPSLPAGRLTKSNSEDDSEDDFMPALPPSLIAQKPTPRAPIGPSLPLGFAKDQEAEEDEDDDDLAGPAPLPTHLKAAFKDHNEGVVALKEREERQRELERIEAESKTLKREEWMLLPPQELDLQASIDPTKIKSRGFKQTSKPHSSAAEGKNKSSSLWTESPAERAQRLADEAIGKRRRAEEAGEIDGEEDLEAAKRKKRDRMVRQQVDQHNKSSRNASLLDLHQTASANVSSAKTAADKQREKAQAVVWDRESMMGINSKLLSDGQKADMIKDAKGLGGRFGGGSFL